VDPFRLPQRRDALLPATVAADQAPEPALVDQDLGNARGTGAAMTPTGARPRCDAAFGDLERESTLSVEVR
jgi:hypothetical protein